MNINFKVNRNTEEQRTKEIIKLIFVILNIEMNDKYINILYEFMNISKDSAKYYTFSRPARKQIYNLLQTKYNYNINTKTMFPVLKKFKDANIVQTDADNIVFFTDKFISLIKSITKSTPNINININYGLNSSKS